MVRAGFSYVGTLVPVGRELQTVPDPPLGFLGRDQVTTSARVVVVDRPPPVMTYSSGKEPVGAD